MTLEELFEADLGFEPEQNVCKLEFVRRDDDNVTCYLVLDKELSCALRSRVPAVDVRVNARGDIILTPTSVGIGLSTGVNASVPLDPETSNALFSIHGADVEYARLILSGGSKIILAPASIQHINR